MPLHEFYRLRNGHWPAVPITSNTVTSICIPLALHLANFLSTPDIRFAGVDMDPTVGHFYGASDPVRIQPQIHSVVEFYREIAEHLGMEFTKINMDSKIKIKCWPLP